MDVMPSPTDLRPRSGGAVELPVELEARAVPFLNKIWTRTSHKKEKVYWKLTWLLP